MRSLSKHLMPLAVVAALLLALALPFHGAYAVTTAAYTTVTIAGSARNDRVGLYGVNSINTPSALCAGYSPVTADSDIMVGAANYMFTLNRYTTMLDFFFGNPNSTGVQVDWSTTTSAPFGTTRFTSAIYSCVTTARTSANSTIFYVSNDRYLYQANPNTQRITATSIALNPDSEYMWDIAIYGSTLYILTTNRVVYACTYASGISCTKVNIQGDAAYNSIVTPSNPTLGIAVNAAGIFIAPQSSLYWFGLDGTLIAKTSDSVQYIDVSFTQSVNLASGGTTSLMAASATGLYSVSAVNSVLTTTLLTSTAYTSSIFHIYPLTLDSVFITQPSTNLVLWTTYANTTVASTISRTPYPVGFVDQSTVLPLMLSYMDYELVEVAGTVPYPSVAIDTSTVAVDPTSWTTGFDVDVSDHYYDAALGGLIQNAPTNGGYARSLRALTSYYNRTNQMIIGDYNLLPMCNLTKMRRIRASIASDVRTLLVYPYIYTGEAKHFTVNAQPNLTLMKLLMPYPFGTYLVDSTFTTNTTTPELLATYDATTAMVVYTRMNYPASNIYDALFPVASYPRFADLSDAQEQVLRWLVYQDAMAQLAKCAAAAGGNAGSGDSGNNGGNGNNGGSGDSDSDSMLAGCVPRVGIDNMTQYQILGVSPTPFNFTLFIPESMYTNFNISACLNNTDWKHVNDFNNTLTHHKSRCGTGCIVGVAVASAVVAAILVVVIVILTSKRRRLATVIVPVTSTEPKFTSTLDNDSNYGSGNPLTY